jgi:putative transposase
MGNHVHLAILRGPEKLSRVMLTLQSAYAQRLNRRHGRVRHLFQGRYKAFLIEKDRYLLALVRYIHENPVKAGLVAQARLVADLYYNRPDLSAPGAF